MSGQRQDYLLRQIELLRQFVARLARTKERAGLEDMLQLSFSLQEKLFAMPPAQFLALDVAGQIASLQAGESRETGHTKCLTYATLLKETAALYEFRGRDDFAFGARQLALEVALTVALDQPVSSKAADELVDELLGSLAVHELHPPVKALLEEYGRL